ncbi:MAG: NADH-quinone oxidoreductase subunit K [Bacteroidia bacterium]
MSILAFVGTFLFFSRGHLLWLLIAIEMFFNGLIWLLFTHAWDTIGGTTVLVLLFMAVIEGAVGITLILKYYQETQNLTLSPGKP